MGRAGREEGGRTHLIVGVETFETPEQVHGSDSSRRVRNLTALAGKALDQRPTQLILLLLLLLQPTRPKGLLPALPSRARRHQAAIKPKRCQPPQGTQHLLHRDILPPQGTPRLVSHPLAARPGRQQPARQLLHGGSVCNHGINLRASMRRSGRVHVADRQQFRYVTSRGLRVSLPSPSQALCGFPHDPGRRFPRRLRACLLGATSVVDLGARSPPALPFGILLATLGVALVARIVGRVLPRAGKAPGTADALSPGLAGAAAAHRRRIMARCRRARRGRSLPTVVRVPCALHVCLVRVGRRGAPHPVALLSTRRNSRAPQTDGEGGSRLLVVASTRPVTVCGVLGPLCAAAALGTLGRLLAPSCVALCCRGTSSSSARRAPDDYLLALALSIPGAHMQREKQARNTDTTSPPAHTWNTLCPGRSNSREISVCAGPRTRRLICSRGTPTQSNESTRRSLSPSITRPSCREEGDVVGIETGARGAEVGQGRGNGGGRGASLWLALPARPQP